MKSIICLICLLGIHALNAQDSILREIKKGDEIPKLEIPVYVDTVKQVFNFNDFKGKLLLLDFWSTHCGSCIVAMPKLLNIEKNSNGKVKVIVVTKDSLEEIKKLWAIMSKKSGPNEYVNAGKQMAIATESEALYKLFPHAINGTHVWVDPNFKVSYISYSVSTTLESIQDYLDNKVPKLAEQIPRYLDIQRPLTWITGDSQIAYEPESYSLFTGPIEYGKTIGHRKMEIEDSSTGIRVGIACINHTIRDLYRWVYTDWKPEMDGLLSDHRFYIEPRNSRRFPTGFDFAENQYFPFVDSNIFSYALKMPLNRASEVNKRMKSDLDTYFNCKSSIEKRKVKCFVIKQIGSTEKLKSKGGASVFKENNERLVIKNFSMEMFIGVLWGYSEVNYRSAVFVDDTKYKGKIDLDIKWSEDVETMPLEMLRTSLKPYGLDVSIENRMEDMLVIKDLNKI